MDDEYDAWLFSVVDALAKSGANTPEQREAFATSVRLVSERPDFTLRFVVEDRPLPPTLLAHYDAIRNR